MQEFNWPVRVYYEDTDAGGVVYHARYIAFYERARTEMLRKCGVNQHLLLAQNIAFVVKKMSVDYIYPARLDDELIITCQVEVLRRASVLFQQKIIDDTGKLYSQAEALIACVDVRKMKPIVLPDFFNELFSK